VTPTVKNPRFGFGGVDAHQNPRPMPEPDHYRLDLKPTDVRVLPGNRIKIRGRFVDAVYDRVFRQDLTGPGFSLISGLDTVFQDQMPLIRAFQVALGQHLAKRRSAEIGVAGEAGFTMKYMGRSNKLKLNPIHCDTKSTDSIAMMLYEPSKDIEAYPFFADLSQFAEDHGLAPTDLLFPGKQVKSHYGNQLKKEYQAHVLAHYAYDLKDLNPKAVQLVVLNDSIGTNHGKSNLGHGHGVRHMAPTGPNPERYFNHLVIDIASRELGQTAKATSTKLGYYEKGLDESLQTPVSASMAIQRYIDSGRIYYRESSNQ
jgi:hypothetical protein